VITGSTRLVALLGHPVAHSLSPRMQNAAFAARGLDWVYVALDVQPDRLAEAVQGLAAGGFAGANVTAPHKVAVLELCNELDEAAKGAESVNTLAIENGRIHGASTDAQALDGIDARRAVVLGAGGAARAWRAALEKRGADVAIYSRSGEWPPRTDGADLIVNATPVVDEVPVEPNRRQAVVDLAYRADGRDTALVAAARAAGCGTIVDGLEVLARQGAASFERWTGVAAPIDVMRAAVRLR